MLPLAEPREPRGERYLSSGVRPRKYASPQDAPGSTVFTAPSAREIAAQLAADPIPISTWRQCATCAGDAARFVSIFAAADSTGIPERLRGANQSVYSTTKP